MRTQEILLSVLLMATMTAQAADHPMAAPAMPAAHDHAAMGGRPVAWTAMPLLKVRVGGEDRASRVITIAPQNVVPMAIDAWSNDLQDAEAHRQLPMGMAGAQLDKPASGGFQMLTAREDLPESVRIASMVYYFGERGAKNPTEMFMLPKNELEIIPQPFPREHSRYRANEEWKFLVRFKGQPLPSQKVVMETSNGSKLESQTDAMGILALRIPDDFKPAAATKNGEGHNHGIRRSAEFVLAVEHTDGAKQYLTAFNSSYGEDAYANRDLAWGMGFTLIGMLGAVPLLRRKPGVKKADVTEDKKDEV